MNKHQELLKYSNPTKVKENALKYFGEHKDIYLSSRKDKKYMIQQPDGKFVHFGGFNPAMEDFTKHQNKERRLNYLKRATNIKGDWKNNKYSPNNLSINLLWN